MSVCGRYVLCVSLIYGVSASVAAADSNAPELVARHLQSIGSAKARSAVNTRVAEGSLKYSVLVGGAGETTGKTVIVSDHHKLNMLLKINASNYHGEQIITDGSRVGVAGTLANKRRSDFGDFLLAQDTPIREGLLGGVLSTAWALNDLDARKATVSFEGSKQVDGRQLEALRYRPKKNTDLTIDLYFDPETGRHVKTVYTATQSPTLRQTTPVPLAGDPQAASRSGEGSDTRSARAGQTRYRIEENFSEFQSIDGLSLPSHYELRFTEELENRSSTTVLWSAVIEGISDNVQLDSRNFEVK